MNPWAVFLTGLTTGGLTCVVVQGGLLLGYLANRNVEGENRGRGLIVPVAAFLGAKLLAYTLLGAALGALGGIFQFSIGVRVALQILAGAFMLVSAWKLFAPRHFPRWLELPIPARFRRAVRGEAKRTHWGVPAVLGALTILIPCGTTQAMEALAVSTGTPFLGAATLFLFVLGTVPLFVLIGVLARGTSWHHHALAKVAAAAVLALGLWTINSALVLADSPIAAQNAWTAWSAGVRNVFGADTSPNAESASTDVTIDVDATGYSPSEITVPRGQPVQLTLRTNKTGGCTRTFVIPKLGIQKNLPETGTTKFTATFTEPGRIAFSCGMGMYRGIINVL
jgi:sulfite exporter TauE/SafE